jgi:hypothetical protein
MAPETEVLADDDASIGILIWTFDPGDGCWHRHKVHPLPLYLFPTDLQALGQCR